MSELRKRLAANLKHWRKKRKLSVEELANATDLGGFFRVQQDGRSLNYNRFTVEGEDEHVPLREGYHSSNTRQLDVQGVCDLLRSTSALEF